MKKILRISALISILSLPVFAYAADVTGGVNKLGDLIRLVTTQIFASLATLLGAAALCAFFFGMVKFILSSRSGDAKEIQKGKDFMLWSVIAMFVMFSVWGIVWYAQDLFGIAGKNTIVIPRVEIQGATGGTGSDPANPSGLPSEGYTCPDGVTKYYNQSDYSRMCNRTVAPTGTSNTGGGSNFNQAPNPGADCTGSSQCQGGLSCINYTCQSGAAACGGITDSTKCTQSGCSWSNAEGCSQ